MKHYYINKDTSTNPNGNNEVHAEGCIWMPASDKCVYIGYCANGVDAVNRAKAAGWNRADGCATCCPEAHYG